jgi:predicted amidohydrolase
MARIAKPERQRQHVSAPPPSDEGGAVAEIDAKELERARRAPAVKDFARYADETLRLLRRGKRRG